MFFHTRPAQPSDADSFAVIGAETFALACPPDTPKADLDAYIGAELGAGRFREHLASPDKALFAAEVGAAVVGYLMLDRAAGPPAVQALRPLQVSRLYVLSRFHGSGVGQALLGVALEQARAGGHDALWLSVSRHNARGIAFYRKLGFRVVGEQRFPVGADLHEDFVMCRVVAERSAA
jgi:diamine N-acetyltransferase